MMELKFTGDNPQELALHLKWWADFMNDGKTEKPKPEKESEVQTTPEKPKPKPAPKKAITADDLRTKMMEIIKLKNSGLRKAAKQLLIEHEAESITALDAQYYEAVCTGFTKLLEGSNGNT